MDFGPRRGKRRRPPIRTSQAEDLMSRADQLSDDGRADEAGGAGNENTHEAILQVSDESHFRLAPYPGKVVMLYWYNG